MALLCFFHVPATATHLLTNDTSIRSKRRRFGYTRPLFGKGLNTALGLLDISFGLWTLTLQSLDSEVFMELLAHASAPSSRKDDEKFKRQAKAYASFYPANVIPIQRSQHVSQAEIPTVLDTPAQAPTFDPSVYLDNTQDAYTALDSQLYPTTQQSDDYTDEEDENVEDDESVSALPMDSSFPSRNVPIALPPNDSSQVGDATIKVSELQPASSLPPSSRLRGQGHQSSSSSRLSSTRQDTTIGYPGGISTIASLKTPLRQPPIIKNSNQGLPEESLSSPADDIPSQLPSTYSISEIQSSSVRNNSDGPATSSAWGSLPRGSAPQLWNGIIEDESPLKGIRSLGMRSIKRSSPLKQTHYLESSRANTSAHDQPSEIKSFSSQDEISSVSLDRAVVPLAKRQTAPAHPALPLSFEIGFSSPPQAQGTQSNSNNNSFSSIAERPKRAVERVESLSFESRFSASPEAQGTQSDVDDVAVRESSEEAPSSPNAKISLLLPETTLFTSGVPFSSSAPYPDDENVHHSKSAIQAPTRSSPWQPTSSPSESGADFPDRARSETAVDVSTPLQSFRIDKRSLLSARVPETIIAAKKRKFASLSTPKTKPNTQEQEILSSLPYQLHPPPPATAVKHFETHVTTQLQQQFWDSPILHGRYKPLVVGRQVRKSERGYWCIDTKTWTTAIQIKFWRFLKSNIEAGQLGWGIWCLREVDEDTTALEESSDGGGDDRREMELGTVKVFCWGEVVGHVWLLCFVASNSKLKYVESRWIDADGEVVVRI